MEIETHWLLSDEEEQELFAWRYKLAGVLMGRQYLLQQEEAWQEPDDDALRKLADIIVGLYLEEHGSKSR
jgi:hypothetical protein